MLQMYQRYPVLSACYCVASEAQLKDMCENGINIFYNCSPAAFLCTFESGLIDKATALVQCIQGDLCCKLRGIPPGLKLMGRCLLQEENVRGSKTKVKTAILPIKRKLG